MGRHAIAVGKLAVIRGKHTAIRERDLGVLIGSSVKLVDRADGGHLTINETFFHSIGLKENQITGSHFNVSLFAHIERGACTRPEQVG